jgi:hypothetical protein
MHGRTKQPPQSRTPSALRTAASILAQAACLGAALVAASATAALATRTRAARDTAHLHLVSSPGSSLLEEGWASGTLPGRLRVHFDVGPTVSASFAIYAKGGTIRGRGSGKLRSAGLYSTFGGSLRITGGSGRYRHARGRGGLYGSINRHTDAMIVQTTGTISF